MIYCPRCGKELNENNRFCTNCGAALPTPSNFNEFTTVAPGVAKTDGSGIAVAGFVLAIIALFGGWIPFIGWLAWLLGLIFSCIGLSKSKRPDDSRKGLAIAGLVISLVALVVSSLVLIVIFYSIGSL
jgi:hypothetical protein